MLYFINCTADIAEQDETYRTYKYVDCYTYPLHINANDDNFYGRLIDCELSVITTLATACTSWNQGIRLTVTINDVDVTSALIGSININHSKNMASTFSLSLGDSQYSPHTNNDIGLSKEVIITAYIDGHEKKLITGIIDNVDMSYTPGISINVSGMDYSKKLLDKKDTLISVQDETDNDLRNEIIEYLAAQAGITDVDIPLMDTVDIDNSFSDQTIWDMVQKEAVINLYWVRFNEDGVMQLRLDEIKTDITTYPTADWTYGEDRLITLSLRKSESDIINKIIVLGSIYESRIPTVEDVSTLLSYRRNWSASDNPYDIHGTETDGDFSINMSMWWAGNKFANYRCRVRWSNNDYEITKYNFAGDNINFLVDYKTDTLVYISFTRYTVTVGGDYESGSLFIELEGRKRDTYETVFTQISASVTDPSSIAKYEERDGGSIELPLIETQDQCIAIGEKIIKESHRGLAQPNFEVPFNPLLETGQTIEITDKKIGFSAERWHVERLNHNISIGGDGVRGRTQVECVYYAST